MAKMIEVEEVLLDTQKDDDNGRDRPLTPDPRPGRSRRSRRSDAPALFVDQHESMDLDDIRREEATFCSPCFGVTVVAFNSLALISLIASAVLFKAYSWGLIVTSILAVALFGLGVFVSLTHFQQRATERRLLANYYSWIALTSLYSIQTFVGGTAAFGVTFLRWEAALLLGDKSADVIRAVGLKLFSVIIWIFFVLSLTATIVGAVLANKNSRKCPCCANANSSRRSLDDEL